MWKRDSPRTLIAGGGLAGLSTAYFLEQQKKQYLLIEKEKELGGLCRTIEKWVYKFDFTGHLLHLENTQIKSLVFELLKDNIQEHKRNSWIYCFDKFIPYPFQNNIDKLPDKIRLKCIKKWSLMPKNPNNFIEWCNYTFGKGITKYFMYPYNKKLFNINPKKLTTTWINKYIPTNKEEGYNNIFYYPKTGGINSLVKSFAEKLNKENLRCEEKITAISAKSKMASLTTKFVHHTRYDNFVSSIPLKELILDIMLDAPLKIKKCAKQLKSNKVLNINIGVRRNITNKHWIYFPENKYIFYRVGFNSNFADDIAPKGCTSIYTEISIKNNIEKTEYACYIDKVIKDLIRAKILTDKDIIDEVLPILIDPAYVIYDKYRDECVSEIIEFLEKNNIYPIGRYGKWEYSAMQDAILDGYNVSNKCL